MHTICALCALDKCNVTAQPPLLHPAPPHSAAEPDKIPCTTPVEVESPCEGRHVLRVPCHQAQAHALDPALCTHTLEGFAMAVCGHTARGVTCSTRYVCLEGLGREGRHKGLEWVVGLRVGAGFRVLGFRF